MWRQKKKYKGPHHPWKKERIDEEHGLAKEYGIRRMQELWKARAIIRNWQGQAKEIIGMRSGPKKEEVQKILLTKLQKFGVLVADADLDDVLSLTLKDVLDKRLATQVFKKGMALTPKQARQFIVHGKVLVNSKKLNSPSYLVKVGDEVGFMPGFTPKLKQIEETKSAEPQAASDQPQASNEKQEATNG